MYLVLRPVRLPLLPFNLGPARGVEVFLLASASSAPSGAGKGEVARSQRIPPVRAASSVASPRSSQHALRRGESGESSEVRSRSRSSRVSRSWDRGTRKDRSVSRSWDRGTRKDRRACSWSASSRDRSRRARSRSASCSRSSDRERRRRASSRSLSSRERSRSSDCYRSRRIAFAVTGRGLRIATGRVVSVCIPLLVGEVTRSPSPLS